jgi:hypothetical protein
MNKIRKKLIHLLGGYTEQEMRESNYNSAQIGKYRTLIEVQAYMRSINGEDAETWCDLAWKHITRKIEAMSNEKN